ncbi:hypothetical protein [uncultured Microbacterium sp.]|uniref:hypothetical protein n=1 Tax=uncultured Microbacterium sp. TaxID=191216 RepID=UPI00262AA95C|nr:hypothetical protein [uncultured Microbacterium sp.]
MAEAPSTRKVQLTVPAADTTVTEWLDLQFSASESVRRLIRESVAREGFVDVANRPVRPPASPVYVGEQLPDEDQPDSAEPTAAPQLASKKPRPAARTAPTTADAGPDHEPDAESAPARIRRERAAPSAATATIDDLLGL